MKRLATQWAAKDFRPKIEMVPNKMYSEMAVDEMYLYQAIHAHYHANVWAGQRMPLCGATTPSD